MAISLINNLYPPIVPDAMPAFIRTQTCRIYFSFPIYNSKNDIKSIQLSLINQKTNTSALRSDLYPSGIKIIDSKLIKSIADEENPDILWKDYDYFIEINTDDLIGKINSDNSITREFGLNQFYKVQLRFTSIIASNPDKQNGQVSAKWLYDNAGYFSEWSKVCLIKGIEKPIITIHGFENSDDIENEGIISTNQIVEIVGKLTFEKNNNLEAEYLKSYNIKLYQADNINNPLIKSQEVYTNPYNPNEFNYQLPYDLVDGVDYIMQLTYTTNNLYTKTISYNFTVIERGIDKINADIFATPDDENGRIKIDIISKDSTEGFIGNLTIRRTSSESNFHKWEDVKTVTYMSESALNYTWYDTTVQSGVWYKYCAQKRNRYGHRGVIIQIEKPVMCVLEDIFLTKNDCQLKIKFNPSLSEFKYNVSQSQQITIGDKFPHITRNGNSYFRSFPIGGLISSFIDTSDWYDPHFEEKEHDDSFSNQFDQEDFVKNKNEIKAFTSKKEIYEESKNLYDEYNDLNNINEYNDYIYEREFREKVYDFLYKHDIKLFRSTTQGNILIKLMNIDFQPVEALGRRLYSFTATAIQIDEANISNYNKYGIQTVGDYQKYIIYQHEVLGSIQGTYQGDIMKVINSKYEKSEKEGFKNEIEGLMTLKLEIESDPFVIIEQNGIPVKAKTNSQINEADATIGHIVYINGSPIIIHSKPTPQIVQKNTDNKITYQKSGKTTYISVFELKENNTFITSLSFDQPTTVTINYKAKLNEKEDEKIASKLYYYKRMGQLYGSFNPKTSLMKKIYNKYVLDYETYYQKLIEITDIQVESNYQNTVVYVKDSKDDDFNRHVLKNGFLQLKDDDATIEGLYFCGVHLTQCKDPLEIQSINGLTQNDFELQTDKIYNNFEEILADFTEVKPKNGNIYQVRAYGLKYLTSLENNKTLIVPKNPTENEKIYYDIKEDEEKTEFYTVDNSLYDDSSNILMLDINHTTPENELIINHIVIPKNIYTLYVEEINDDERLQFVYYYGYWYLLQDIKNRIKLSQKENIRQIRDYEYIMTNQSYLNFEDIKNPIPNGVYQIRNPIINNPVSYDRSSGLLIINEDNIYQKTDNNYGLFLEEMTQASSQYIYYHGKWYNFTLNHDVICPIDGIVDYCYEIVKGVY